MGNRRGGNPSRKRASRGPGFIKTRLLLGAVCIAAAFVMVYRSCLIGIFKEGAGLGWWGMIPSVCFLVAGILSIQMLRRRAPIVFLAPFVLCFAADITSLIHASRNTEWRVWGIVAAILAIIYLMLLCFNRQRNLEAPLVFLAATIVVTVLLLIFIKNDGSEGAAEQNSEEAAEEGEEPEVVDVSRIPQPPTDGSLYLATDTFVIQYAKHEKGEDVNGEPCLYVYYTFTNNSPEAVTIPSVSYTKLIQNEAECSKASVEEMNEEMNNYKNSVDPGMTVTACEVYMIADTSQVELQAIEFVPTNAKTASQILKIG